MSIKEVSAKIRKISTTVVVANGFRFAVFVVTTLLVFSLAARVCQARKGPSERQIKKAVNQLDLTPREKENLILSIYTGAQDGLLDFSSEIGTKTLLKVLNSQGSGPQKKAQFIRKYQQAIEEKLPLFLVTKTSIRMFKTGAPFNTVLSTVNKQIILLRKVRNYLNQDTTPLYLTRKNEAALIDTLAESIVTFARQQTSDGISITETKIAEFERTLYNTVKFSSLPVTLQGNSGVKGGSGSGESNPQLRNFLKEKNTIRALAKLAKEFL